MLQTQQSVALSISAARFLKAKGAFVDQLEDHEAHQRKLQTELMLGFRDTRRPDLFEALYRLSQPQILAWISVMRRGSARALDPDDLTQEVFLNVYRYASSFRDRSGGFGAWCMTIARNLIHRQARDLQRRSMRPLKEGCDPVDPCVGPREATIGQEEAAHLRRAWQTYLLAYAAAYGELKPRDQEALRLVEIEGLRYSDAALRLGVRLSNMKMILLRARRRIWKRIGVWEGPQARAAG